MSLQSPRTCFACGRKDRGVHDVGAMNESFKACSECLQKHGAPALALEADRLLSQVYSPKANDGAPPPGPRLGICFHCADPVIQQPDGSWPLWCTRCESERKALEGRRATA